MLHLTDDTEQGHNRSKSRIPTQPLQSRILRVLTAVRNIQQSLPLWTVGDPPRWPRDIPLSTEVSTKFRRQVAVAQ
jgi:hypothetical protein